MTFTNQKKTFLSKLDKSKKGEIDVKVIPLITLINARKDMYTTSSCSGRIDLWVGNGKKNQCEWLKVSHNFITEDFFNIAYPSRLVWLRLEPFIMHICCKDLDVANALLEKAKKIYKKSCILTAQNKIILEIRGSEAMEMPFALEGKVLFNGKRSWLVEFLNEKMKRIEEGITKFEKMIISLTSSSKT